MTVAEALWVMSKSIGDGGDGRGFDLSEDDEDELKSILEEEGFPESVTDCRALVKGEDDAPTRALKTRFPSLDKWLDDLFEGG